MYPVSRTSTATLEPARSEFRTQLFRSSRAAAVVTAPTRDVILLFRGVLDSSANGRRSAQIALDTVVTGTQEIALWR